MITLLSDALKYADRGWPVFPLKQKAPLTTNGWHDASTDPDVIMTMNWAAADGIGMANGVMVNGHRSPYVFDADPRHGSDATLKELASKHHLEPPVTLMARSGSGGGHWYYFSDKPWPRTIGKIGPGLDLCGVGGYIVLPPSKHPDGGVYSWLNDEEIAPLPDWMANPQANGQPTKKAPKLPKIVPAGQQRQALLSLAGTLRGRGLGAEVIFVALRKFADESCPPADPNDPWTDQELMKISTAYEAKVAGNPLPGTTSPPNSPPPTNLKDVEKLIKPFTMEKAQKILSEPPPIDLSLPESAKAEYVGKRVRIAGHVIGKDTTPFQVPRKVRVTYLKFGEEGEAASEEVITKEFKSSDPLLIQMTRSSATQLKGLIKQSCGLGPKVPATIESLSYWNVEAVLVQPIASQMSIYTAAGEKVYEVDGQLIAPEMVCRELYIISDGKFMNDNTAALMEGTVVPSGKTQYATLLVDKFEPAVTDLTQFKMTPKLIAMLKAFQPSPGQDPLAKLDVIAKDMTANVTKCWRREDFVIVVDLTYHSARSFELNGEIVNGWITAAAIGDTGQAKTTIVKRLVSHFGLGTYVCCDTGARTGLKGSVESNGDRRYLKWGTLPQNDGRFVALDEYVRIPEKERGELREIHSDGVASFQKAIQASTYARVRTVITSNPKDTQPVSAFTFGFEALRSVFDEAMERRIDLGIILRKGDVSVAEANEPEPPVVTAIATADRCRASILWAWTRQAEHIKFVDGAEYSVLKTATELSEKWADCRPLIEAMSLRHKIARFSVAIAIRLFSTDDGENVLVRHEHVDAAKRLFLRIYNAPNFSLDAYAEIYRKNEVVDMDEIAKTLETILGNAKEVDKLLELYLDTPSYRYHDLQELMGMEKDDRMELVIKLIGAGLIKSDSSGAKRTARLKRYAFERMKIRVGLSGQKNLFK